MKKLPRKVSKSILHSLSNNTEAWVYSKGDKKLWYKNDIIIIDWIENLIAPAVEIHLQERENDVYHLIGHTYTLGFIDSIRFYFILRQVEKDIILSEFECLEKQVDRLLLGDKNGDKNEH